MSEKLSYGDDYKFIPATSLENGVGTEVLPDVFCFTNHIVNISLIGKPDANNFVLIDAGMPYAAKEIISVVRRTLW